jgi:hypothetical protein
MYWKYYGVPLLATVPHLLNFGLVYLFWLSRQRSANFLLVASISTVKILQQAVDSEFARVYDSLVFLKRWLPLEKWLRRAKKTNQDIIGFTVLTCCLTCLNVIIVSGNYTTDNLYLLHSENKIVFWCTLDVFRFILMHSGKAIWIRQLTFWSWTAEA